MRDSLKLRLRCENGVKCPLGLRRRIARAARAVLAAEEIRVPCELSVLLTDDAGIHALNKAFRGVDRPTDVLSFPMGDTDPRTGRYLLGDMALNTARAAAQGREFGHGPEHEITYLTVHSVLHLLGYDHEDEGEQKRAMRAREKAIMAVLEPRGIVTEE